MKVGFIGLGTMGGSMALNLRKAGFELVVHDMRADAAKPQLAAGATWAGDVKALGKAVDVVLTSLPGPREAEAVGADLMASMKRGGVWFDLTTNSPTVVRSLSARCAEHGISMLDARSEARQKSLATGVWPPSVVAKKEGLPEVRLTAQENKILMPSAFSPLQ